MSECARGVSSKAEAWAAVLSGTHLTAGHGLDLGTYLPGEPTA
jgi:hypothetical protein